MAANAGYQAVLHVSGVATTLTDEPCSLVSGKTYRVTDSAKRVLDPSTAIVVKDDGVAVSSADIEDIDLLFGKVTFASGYTIVGAITIASGKYLPLAIYGVARSFSAQMSRSILDSTVMDGASAHRQKLCGLKDVSGSVGALDYADTSVGGSTIYAKLAAGTPFVLAFGPEGNVTTSPSLRARVILENAEVGAEVDNLVDDSLSFQLAPTTSVDGYDVSYSLDT